MPEAEWSKHQNALLAAVKSKDPGVLEVQWNEIRQLNDPHVPKMLPFVFKSACASGVDPKILALFWKITTQARSNMSPQEFIGPALAAAYNARQKEVIQYLLTLAGTQQPLYALLYDQFKLDPASASTSLAAVISLLSNITQDIRILFQRISATSTEQEAFSRFLASAQVTKVIQPTTAMTSAAAVHKEPTTKPIPSGPAPKG